jgi:hypothetical protein
MLWAFIAAQRDFNRIDVEPQKLRSGATLLQDENFMSAGKAVKDSKIVALKPV